MKLPKAFMGQVVLAYVLGGWNSSPYSVADFLHSFRQTDFFSLYFSSSSAFLFFPY